MAVGTGSNWESEKKGGGGGGGVKEPQGVFQGGQTTWRKGLTAGSKSIRRTLLAGVNLLARSPRRVDVLHTVRTGSGECQ